MSKDNPYDNIQIDKIKEIQLSVEDNSHTMENIVNEIIKPYCKDLDNYVSFIADILKDGQNPPTANELDDFCMNLSTYIYFAGGMCEQLGIRDDISKAVWKECFHTARASQDKGTVADKDSLAELCSQQEQLTNICYSRAYKIMKSKVENAQELLSSCKKVISRRMQEQSLTNLTGGN
jgi:hypothetical protein